MIDLKKSKDSGTTVELDLVDQIKDKLQEGLSFNVVVVTFLKIALIAIGPALIKLTEMKTIGSLKKDLGQINAELQAKQSQVQKLNNEIKVFDRSKIKKSDFDNKSSILGKLAQERLQVIEVLDNLQQSIDILGDKNKSGDKFMFFDSINITGNAVTINAMANDEEIVKDFLLYLEGENLYSSIRLDRISSEKGSLRKFLVSGQLAERKFLQ